MKRFFIAVVLLAIASAATAQDGLVVGLGNFFSPIVGDLDKAIAFYRDGIGLDIQGTPANAEQNPALRNMFGLPDAQLRWQIGRPAGMRSGVEIVEIKKAGGRGLERRLQDIGATTLIVLVRDLDSVFGRLKQLGAPVVTKGGAPLFVPGGARKSRAVIVQDPDGHFVELFQPDPLPEATATPAPNVLEVRVRLAVADVERETRLYRDALGLAVRAPGEFAGQPTVLDMMGTANYIRVQTFRVYEPLLSAALIYIFLTFVLTRIFRWVEQRLNRDRVEPVQLAAAASPSPDLQPNL